MKVGAIKHTLLPFSVKSWKFSGPNKAEYPRVAKHFSFMKSIIIYVCAFFLITTAFGCRVSDNQKDIWKQLITDKDIITSLHALPSGREYQERQGVLYSASLIPNPHQMGPDFKQCSASLDSLFGEQIKELIDKWEIGELIVSEDHSAVLISLYYNEITECHEGLLYLNDAQSMTENILVGKCNKYFENGLSYVGPIQKLDEHWVRFSTFPGNPEMKDFFLNFHYNL